MFNKSIGIAWIVGLLIVWFILDIQYSIITVFNYWYYCWAVLSKKQHFFGIRQIAGIGFHLMAFLSFKTVNDQKEMMAYKYIWVKWMLSGQLPFKVRLKHIKRWIKATSGNIGTYCYFLIQYKLMYFLIDIVCWQHTGILSILLLTVKKGNALKSLKICDLWIYDEF